jgi:hypothetical protein
MSNEHVDYMLYELARAAILARISELSHELRKAREDEQADLMIELQSQRLELWRELHELPANVPKTCASIVRKYSTNMVRTQSVIRDLNKLRTP